MPSLERSIGALSFPVSGSGDLASLDPARDILVELLAAAINDELTARWQSNATGPLLGTLPVQSAHPFEPDQETLQQFKSDFPALFVYRETDTATRREPHTLWEERLISRWGVDYFLGPLAVGSRGAMQDMLTAVGKVIASTIDAGGHRAYAETTTPGGIVHRKFVLGPNGAGTCGFSTINLVEFQIGPAQFTADSTKYWACSATLETHELDALTGTDADFTGVTTTLGTGNSDGIVTDLVVVDTDDTDGALG